MKKPGSQRHDFFKLMAAVRETLSRDYQRIRSRSAEDPGTAGDQAEEDWAEILRKWLPAIYPVITKGRILFEDGTSSPQIDILVLKPSYPLGLRTEKYVFAGGVLAAFECKLTLVGKHIAEAFETAQIIKAKSPKRRGSPYEELNSTPLVGLLAHSHSFKSSRADFKIHELTEKNQTKYAKHAYELLDIICVADSVTIPLSKYVMIGRDLDEEALEQLRDLGQKELISTMYVMHTEDITPYSDDTGAILAGFIHELTYRLAFEDPSIRDWAEHLSMLGFYGGIGRPIFWTPDELSADVLKKLRKSVRGTGRWDKWGYFLP
jgi:hypothetical protein